jgi:hypothetical protein
MDGGGEEERIEGKRRKEASERDAGERGPSPESRSWGLGELGGGTCRCLQLQDRARLSLSGQAPNSALDAELQLAEALQYQAVECPSCHQLGGGEHLFVPRQWWYQQL